MTIVIKNVSPENWNLFKAEAARHGVRHGEFFSRLVKEHLEGEKSGTDAWDKILNRKPRLTEKEAHAIMNASRELRKDFKLRYD